MYTKIFKYKVVEEKPIEALEEFKEHHRLQVFYLKGLNCVCCERVGTKLIQGEGRGKLHWDIYCEDGIPMSVDHIVPKSKGGSDHIDNLQPMCILCNRDKGNGDTYQVSVGHACRWPRKEMSGSYLTSNNFKKVTNPTVGLEVWRKKGMVKLHYLGRISAIVQNQHTGELNYMIEDNNRSMYNFSKTYIQKSS